MRKRSLFIFAGIISLFALIAFTAYKPVPAGPSANGQGGLLLDGRVQQFSFHANTDKDGTVTGSWESNSPGQECRTHGDITCLTILPDGKTAFMSGTITQVDGVCFNAKVGDPIWFKVQDNGEGANATEDGFTDYYFFLAGCLNYNIGLKPILNGNIQVKP